MKKTLKLMVVALLFGAAVVVPSKAGAQKFGHINSQEIVALMPERDSAIVKLQKFGKELTEVQQAMQKDFEAKLKEYQDKRATWTEATIKVKEEELTSLQQRIEQYTQTAQQDFNSRQEALLTPVMKKAQEAIDKVAKAQGITYVFDLATGAIIYTDETSSVNLLPLVKAELGIPASKVQPTQFQQ